MRILRDSKGSSNIRMKPMAKRILITKVVAATHERLARSGIFRRAFIRAGTWLPRDRSADSEVCLQGVDFKYDEVITSAGVEARRKEFEAQAAEAEALRKAAIKLEEEKERALAEQFAPAVERSTSV